MDDENAPRSKRRRLDPYSFGSEPHGSNQQDLQPKVSRAPDQSHVYPVVHLDGNSQAIFGNINDSSGFFRNGSNEVSKRLLLNALYFEGMQSRRDQIAARAGSPKYIEWVWTTSFNTWLQSSESFYWITGCPGSGKSTLMKHISDSRKTLNTLQANGEEWTTIHFFFDFRAKVGTANTINGMLRSLLYQTAKHLPEVAKHLESTLLVETLSEIGLHEYMDNLCDAIRQTSTRICAFIDGLDEFDGSGSDLLEAIHSLEDRSGIKICMASRPYPVFQENLLEYQHLVMQNHNYQSIQSYTEAQFNSNRFVGAASLPRKLADKVREKAHGVFLWARLATDELLRDLLAGNSVTELEHHLDQMPQEVQDMYQRILLRLPEVHKMEAALLLYILTVSKGTVEIRKLFVAMQNLASRLPKKYEIQPVDEDSNNDRRLLALLGDFVDVSIDSSLPRATFTYGKAGMRFRYPWTPISMVRLTHETLYAYLTNNEWLEHVLSPHLSICNGPRFWSDLYLDEMLDCLERCEALPPTTLDRYRSFIKALVKGSFFSALTESELGKSYAEVVTLLGLWKEWTPLLPYALHEVFLEEFNGVNSPCFERIDDLQRVLRSPISWLHKLICVLEGVDVVVKHGGSFETLHLWGACNFEYKPGSAPGVLDHHISIPLCHSMTSCLAQLFSNDQCSFSPAIRQSVFDFCWVKFTYSEGRKWRDPVLMLAQAGSHFGGKHLCQFLTGYCRGEELPHILELPKSEQEIQEALSEHHLSCEFYRSWTPEVGFLCHWGIMLGKCTDEEMIALFKALSMSQEHLNQIASPIGEPLLNVILKGSKKLKSYTYPISVMLKFVLALEAGANPYVVGRSGTAFDVAKNELEEIRRHDLLDSYSTNCLASPQFLQMEKIIELLEHYANHDGELPKDLDKFLKFNVRQQARLSKSMIKFYLEEERYGPLISSFRSARGHDYYYLPASTNQSQP